MQIETWRVAGLLAALAVFWIAYADLKDHGKPEPRWRLLQAFGLGALSCAGALCVFRLLAWLGISLPDASSLGIAAYCIGVIGPVEEGAKFLVFIWFIRRWQECDEPVDGYVYASALGCGFATLENALYLPGMNSFEQLARAAVLPINHALYAAIWGLPLTRAQAHWTRLVGLLGLSMLLHGVYDFVVIQWQASVIASAIVLGIWVIVLVRVRSLSPPREKRVGRHHPPWEYVAKVAIAMAIGFLIWLSSGCLIAPHNGESQPRGGVIDSVGPAIQVSAGSLHTRQGGTFAPLLLFDEPISTISADFDGADLPIYPVIRSDGSLLYRGMVGIWVKRAAGTVPLTLRAVDLAGNESARTVEVIIEPTQFSGGGRVRLPSSKKRTMAENDRRRVAQEHRNAAYAVDIPVQLWLGDFARPTEGRRTSAFGKFREYNTGVRRHHLGVDIGAATGTPVFAANHGVVTLSEYQHTFGHVVIVSHGVGMSTSYNHLSAREREVGERVRKGDRVGQVGSTGLSTGPHLHWGMEVGGYAVDAEEWQKHSFDGEGVGDFF